jgi:uncharacterized protein (DUF1697 family)
MAVMVALLRGINVGGRGTLPMRELRDIVVGCGYEDVSTYIQSGNVVLTSSERDPDRVARKIRAAIAGATDVDPQVVVVTRTELAGVVAKSPLLARGLDAAHLHVVFLETPAKAALRLVDLERYAPETAAATGRQLHLFLPGGLGRSKLAADLARRMGANGTTRNWRTVTKLLAMADELA